VDIEVIKPSYSDSFFSGGEVWVESAQVVSGLITPLGALEEAQLYWHCSLIQGIHLQETCRAEGLTHFFGRETQCDFTRD